MRTFDVDFPNSQARSLVGLEHAVAFLGTAFHVNERLELRLVRGLRRQHADHPLGCHRAVAEADFRLVTGLHVNLPLKPFRFLIGQFDACQRGHLGNITGARDAAAPVDRGNFHYQRIAIAKVTEGFAVIMHAPHRRRPHANGVHAAVRHAALPVQRQETDVPTAIMAAIQIGVRCLRHKPEAAGQEQLGQILGILALEIERRFLRVLFGDWPGAKLRGPTNGLFGSCKIVIHQPAGSDEAGTVVVEAVDFDFLGEFLRRIPDLDIEPEQVADRLPVLP